MLCGIGSTITAATSPSASTRSVASRSLKGTTAVAATVSGIIPVDIGSWWPTRSAGEITFMATASCQPW